VRRVASVLIVLLALGVGAAGGAAMLGVGLAAGLAADWALSLA
jgi:hypothetical protein